MDRLVFDGQAGRFRKPVKRRAVGGVTDELHGVARAGQLEADPDRHVLDVDAGQRLRQRQAIEEFLLAEPIAGLDEFAQQKRIDVVAFWLRRVARLVPALLLVLAAVAILGPGLFPKANIPTELTFTGLYLSNFTRIAWTPPVLVGTRLYIRDRRNMMAVDLG